VAQQSFAITKGDAGSWRSGGLGLTIAAGIVGLAIVIGGPAARVLNSIAALLWIASGVVLARGLPDAVRPRAGWAVALASGVGLAAVVRPGDLPAAIVGFGLAGLAIALSAGDRSGAWALLGPAIYLPVHLAVGVGRALLHGTGMRTEPPPTAAVVPLAMVLAAAAGGAVAAAIVRRNR
jgi:hypothetical protein